MSRKPFFTLHITFSGVWKYYFFGYLSPIWIFLGSSSSRSRGPGNFLHLSFTRPLTPAERTNQTESIEIRFMHSSRASVTAFLDGINVTVTTDRPEAWDVETGPGKLRVRLAFGRPRRVFCPKTPGCIHRPLCPRTRPARSHGSPGRPGTVNAVTVWSGNACGARNLEITRAPRCVSSGSDDD